MRLLQLATSLQSNALPRLPTVLARVATSSGAVALFHAPAAFADDASAVAPPDDTFIVGFAIFLLVCTGLLNLSLGDVIADEA
jgi:hypothetical protein